MTETSRPVSVARARRMASQAIDRAARLRQHADRDIREAEKAENDAEFWERYATEYAAEQESASSTRP